jgi:molybdate transport system ATP-binding protein
MPDEGEGALRVHITLARPSRGVAQDRFSLDVAFDAQPGFTLLLGPSGAGKSTVLSAIAGFVRPTTGRIVLGHNTWFDADGVVDVAPQERHVAIVFQSLALFPHMTAGQNVAYGMARSIDRAARASMTAALLERLRVAHLASRKPPTFSGGEAQRVALARALAAKPRVVLLDEPFSALDPALRRELSADLRGVLRELDVPVLLVTHQPDEIAAPGDRLIHMAAGRITSGASVSAAETPSGR